MTIPQTTLSSPEHRSHISRRALLKGSAADGFRECNEWTAVKGGISAWTRTVIGAIDYNGRWETRE